MFKNRPLFKTIGELPTERRLNVMIPILGVIALAGVVYFLWNVISNDRQNERNNLLDQVSELKVQLKEQKQEFTIKIDKLEYRVDSLTQNIYQISLQRYSDKSETVNQLKLLIKKQRETLK